MGAKDALDELLAEAAEALKEDEDGVLSLGYREMIWAQLGSRTPDPLARPLAQGHLRRIHLAVLAVRKVLPLWLRVEPSDISVRDSLALILRASTESVPDLDRLAHTHWEQCEHSDDPIPQSIHAAASRAIVTLLEDETFDPEERDPEMADAALDAYDHDAGFWASCVAANGPTWIETSDPEKRRAFWTWWLQEAVPKAWAAAS